MTAVRKITKTNIKRKLTYNVGFALEYGVEEAIVLSKLVSFSEIRMRDNGFTWCLYDELEEQTGLTRPRIKSAIRFLKEEGFIEVKRMHIQEGELLQHISCNHFKLNENKSIIVED